MNFPDNQFEFDEPDGVEELSPDDLGETTGYSAEELSDEDLFPLDADEFSAGDLEEAYQRALEVLERADHSTPGESAEAPAFSQIDDENVFQHRDDASLPIRSSLPIQAGDDARAVDEFPVGSDDSAIHPPDATSACDRSSAEEIENPASSSTIATSPSVADSHSQHSAHSRKNRRAADTDPHVPFSDRDFPELSPGSPLTPRHVIEAALFVGGAPLTTKKLAGLFKGSYDNAYIEQQIDDLNRHYLEQNRPYEIRLVEGGHRLVLRPEFERVRHRVFGFGPKEVRLSQDALEVLALVAYQQPLHRDDLEECGKKNVSNLVNQLVRRELVGVTRGKNAKDLTYHTTPRFLTLFGIGSLDELPRPDDLAFK